jgi:hypothetical protein
MTVALFPALFGRYDAVKALPAGLDTDAYLVTYITL